MTSKQQVALTPEQQEQVRTDFLQWSGGEEPSWPDQIKRYVRYGRPADLSAKAVRDFLVKWAGIDPTDM